MATTPLQGPQKTARTPHMTWPKVHVLAWNNNGGAAIVSTRVRVRRSSRSVRWICDTCGTQETPTCPHARAFADTPIPTEETGP